MEEAVEVGDKTTPTPLLEGDLVYLARKDSKTNRHTPVVWQVDLSTDSLVLLTSSRCARRYIDRSLLRHGVIRRVDGSPILID